MSESAEKKSFPMVLSRRHREGIRDALLFRDPRGRSSRPAILPSRAGDLFVRDRFILRQDFVVSKEAGRRFVDLTRDANPIHTEGDIVPGALTISKTLLPLEVLFDRLTIVKVRTKFTRPSYYGRRTVTQFFVSCGNPETTVRAATFQDGQVVAETEVRARTLRGPELPAREAQVEPEAVGRIRDYLECLDVDSEAYFHRAAADLFTYPKAYLASLPSGELVRQLEGQGGLLNILELEFEEGKYVPISEHPGPAVVLEEKRNRRTFHQVVARIWDGLVTFCRGSALLHPPIAAH